MTATAFVGGTVLTMDERRPAASVLVVRDGRIAAVGDVGLERDHPDAELVEVDGRLVVPGFVDAHQHLSLTALHPRWADLRDAVDLDTVRTRLADSARREPDAPWIRGCGWDQFATGLHLDRHDLDAMGFHRPVLIGCFTYHRAVVSSAGLDALGITAATEDPPGGRIERDATGRPTGELTERAWTRAHVASLAGYDDPDRWGDLVVAEARRLLTEGITAVHDAACTPAAEAVYRDLARSARLPIGVLAMPHGAILDGPVPERLDHGPPTGEGDEALRVGAVKLFADGGIDLAIDAHLGEVHVEVGWLMPDLVEGMVHALRRGFDVAVHAMGNAGLRATLDAWETARRAVPHADACRLRLEHATLAGPTELARLVDLGATAVIQPGFVHLVGRNIGDLRFDDATFLPYADLLASGIALAAGSDGPCYVTDPLLTSRQGVTRLTEEGAAVGIDQAVPMREWLRLYTAGAADAGRQTAERGRLRPGLRADLVVLSGGTGRVDASALDGADALTVEQTWVAGARVHRRGPVP
ncbi:MAG: amidohydrolase [Acidimicrobiales bacterium]|jgi:hypothetical protein|nr:amidohydrolase [Acidimicrobiales bacterium]